MTNRKPLRINTDREYYKLLFTRRLIKNPPAEILAEHNQRRGDYDFPVLFTNKNWLRELVRSKEPGLYTLKEIFGPWWSIVRRPRLYGRFFSWHVKHGEIPGIRFAIKQPNRTIKYEIFNEDQNYEIQTNNGCGVKASVEEKLEINESISKLISDIEKIVDDCDLRSMELVLMWLDMWAEYNLGPDVGLTDLTEEDLSDFMSWLREDGKCRQETLANTARQLNQAYRYAYTAGLIGRNIAAGLVTAS